MLTKDQIIDLIAEPNFSKIDRLLLLLAFEANKPKDLVSIRSLATMVGIPELTRINIGAFLNAAKPRAINLKEGWILTAKGKNYIQEKFLKNATLPAPLITSKLRKYVQHTKQADTKAFLGEAVSCFEASHYRAAVVLTWVGAISLLQDYIIQKRLKDFNLEAKRRDASWKEAKTKDDLSRMKENDFLNILEYLSVVGKNVKQQLQAQCLNLRNGCGHPNSMAIGEHVVAAHIEFLILNIFDKF